MVTVHQTRIHHFGTPDILEVFELKMATRSMTPERFFHSKYEFVSLDVISRLWPAFKFSSLNVIARKF